MSVPTKEEHSACVEAVRTPTDRLAWHVKCYDLVKALLTDDRVVVSDPDPGANRGSHRSAAVVPLVLTPRGEGGQHRRTREVMQSFATARSASRLRPVIEKVATEQVERFAARQAPVDFHSLISLTYPVVVAATVLGVAEDAPHLGDLIWRANDADDWQVAKRANDDLRRYMREQLALRRTHPRADVLTALSTMDAGSADANQDIEPVERIATTILVAATVAPTIAIDHGLMMLLSRAPARARLFDERTSAGLISEMLRFGIFDPTATAGHTNGLHRYANADFQLADAWVCRGDMLLLNLHEANFDPGHFPEPYTFRWDRSGSPHLSFGFGRRRCPGANLALHELLALFRVFFTRLPEASLVGKPTDHLRKGRVAGLPVVW